WAGARDYRRPPDLPGSRASRRTGRRSEPLRAGALVADRSRLADAAEIPGATLATQIAGRQRAFQVRAGGRDRVFRAARLARSRIPIELARVVAAETHD